MKYLAPNCGKIGMLKITSIPQESLWDPEFRENPGSEVPHKYDALVKELTPPFYFE